MEVPRRTEDLSMGWWDQTEQLLWVLVRGIRGAGEGLWKRVRTSDRTRGNGSTLKLGWVTLDIMKKFFLVLEGRPWYRVDSGRCSSSWEGVGPQPNQTVS